MNLLVSSRTGEDLIPDFFVLSHVAPQDVGNVFLIEYLHRIVTDHLPVRDQAEQIHRKAFLEAIRDGNQGLHIRRVSRPDLAAHRTAVIIDERRHRHLVQVRSMIFAVPLLSQGLSALALKVDRGGIKEEQVSAREKIAVVLEKLLLVQR